MINIKKKLTNPIVIITGVSLIIYFQTFFFGQVFFDDYAIISNPLSKVSNIDSFKGIIFSKYLGGHYYRPLTLFSFYVNSTIAGERSWIYHLTNFLIHLTNILVLYKILIKLKFTVNLSLFFSLLFAVHPLFINAVVWIAGRNDLLVGLFCLLAFYNLISYSNNNKWYTILFFPIFLFLAFFSKESAVFFPLICLLFWSLIKDNKEIYFNDLKIFLSSIATILLYFLIRFLISTSVSLDKFSFDVFLTKIRILPETLYKALFPLNLQVLPNFNFCDTFLGILILIILVAFPSIMKSINKKNYWFGIIWFIVMMLPGMLAKTISEEGLQYWDCRAYLPAAGLFIALAEIVSKLNVKFNNKLISGFAISCLIIFSLANIVQSSVYKNPVTFWHSAINDFPDNSFFYERLYKYYVINNNYDEALKTIEIASQLNPEQKDYFLKAIEICLKQMNLIKAREIIELAYKYHPEDMKLLAYKIGTELQLCDIKDLSISQNLNVANRMDKRKLCDEINAMERIYFNNKDSLKCREFINMINN